MALVTCKECGKEHSAQSAKCPHCGFKRPKPVGVLGIVVAGLFAYGVFSYISGSPKASPPPKTPDQMAAEAKSEAAFQKVVLAIKAIKTTARNPDSIKFESISANIDASVICIEYRGQNGFGGFTKEFTVLANSKASQKPEAWNKHCANKPLRDMTHATHAL